MGMALGRKRKSTVARSPTGKSRGERPDQIMGVVLAYRQKHGIAKEDAHNALAGFTLGRMKLCGLAARRTGQPDYRSVTEEQFQAGERWAQIVRRHATVMGYELTRVPRSPSFSMVGGGLSCAEDPDAREIAKALEDFAKTYNKLVEASREHGLHVINVTYAVCIENRPLDTLTESDCGSLRIGLNALSRVLK